MIVGIRNAYIVNITLNVSFYVKYYGITVSVNIKNPARAQYVESTCQLWSFEFHQILVLSWTLTMWCQDNKRKCPIVATAVTRLVKCVVSITFTQEVRKVWENVNFLMLRRPVNITRKGWHCEQPPLQTLHSTLWNSYVFLMVPYFLCLRSLWMGLYA